MLEHDNVVVDVDGVVVVVDDAAVVVVVTSVDAGLLVGNATVVPVEIL